MSLTSQPSAAVTARNSDTFRVILTVDGKGTWRGSFAEFLMNNEVQPGEVRDIVWRLHRGMRHRGTLAEGKYTIEREFPAEHTMGGQVITDEIPIFTREFTAYATAHGRTPEEQKQIDAKRFPGGCMCGFILWMSDRLAQFKKAHPEHCIGNCVADHDAKCRFIEGGVS